MTSSVNECGSILVVYSVKGESPRRVVVTPRTIWLLFLSTIFVFLLAATMTYLAIRTLVASSGIVHQEPPKTTISSVPETTVPLQPSLTTQKEVTNARSLVVLPKISFSDNLIKFQFIHKKLGAERLSGKYWVSFQFANSVVNRPENVLVNADGIPSDSKQGYAFDFKSEVLREFEFSSGLKPIAVSVGFLEEKGDVLVRKFDIVNNKLVER